MKRVISKVHLAGLGYTGGWLVGLILFALMCWAVWMIEPVGDIAWRIYAVEQWLGGATLYEDLLVTEPPEVYFLTAIPVALAQMTGDDPLRYYMGFVLLLVPVSAVLCLHIIHDSREMIKRPFGNVLIIIIFLVLSLLPIASGNATYRIEHLFVILILPWLLGTLPSAEEPHPRPLAARMAGVLAGIGFSLRLEYLALWLVIEGILWIREGRLLIMHRPLHRSAAVTIGGMLFLMLTWAYGYSYQLLPLLASDRGLPTLLEPSGMLTLETLLLPLGAAAAFFLIKPSGGWKQDIFMLFFWVLLLSAAAMLAYTDAPHLYYPAQAVAVLLLPFLFFNFVYTEGHTKEAFREGAGIAACLGALVMIFYQVSNAHYQLRTNEESREVYWRLADNLNAYAFDKGVFFFQTTLWPAFPLANNTGATWPMRFSHLWPLLQVYGPTAEAAANHAAEGEGMARQEIAYRPPQGMRWLEYFLTDTLRQDFQEYQPFVLVVDESPENLRSGYFDFMGYFAQDPRFAEILEQYKLVERVDLCEEYDLRAQCRYDIYHLGVN